MRFFFVYDLLPRENQLWNLDGISGSVRAVIWCVHKTFNDTVSTAEITYFTIICEANTNNGGAIVRAV
jgi:hypothetical protein